MCFLKRKYKQLKRDKKGTIKQCKKEKHLENPKPKISYQKAKYQQKPEAQLLCEKCKYHENPQNKTKYQKAICHKIQKKNQNFRK